MAKATLPVYMRVGSIPEREIGTIEVGRDAAISLESAAARQTVVDALRSLADEIESRS